MSGIVSLMAGTLIAAQGSPAPAPRLPYLENPSVTYGDCIEAASSGQRAPRIAVIGANQCRQPRSILWSAIRYHVALSWSDLAESRAEERRISARVDQTARSILQAYEADLQRWIDARAAANGSRHAQDR